MDINELMQLKKTADKLYKLYEKYVPDDDEDEEEGDYDEGYEEDDYDED